MNEEIELAIVQSEGKKPDADRIERIAKLKAENTQLKERFDSESADKSRYKKELRATKKIAKGALKRVAELEADIKADKEKWKKEATDYKVEIHTLKNQLANAGPSTSAGPGATASAAAASASSESSSGSKGSTIRRLEEEGRGRSGSVSSALSGIATMDQNKEIEGGVGQKVVQMKEKKAAAYAKDGKAGRYDTMRGMDGEVVKTETGLTVINTNKKVEKMVAHEMNVAKIQVMEGRNLTPKKVSKTGMEIWFKLEMGSAAFQSPAQSLSEDQTGAKWG